VGLVAMMPASAPSDELDGHISPLRAQLTFTDGTTRDVLFWAIGLAIDIDRDHRFQMTVGTPEGSELTAWYDTLASINNITDEGFTLVFKRGRVRQARYDTRRHAVWIRTPEDSFEKIPINRLTEIRFLGPSYLP